MTTNTENPEVHRNGPEEDQEDPTEPIGRPRRQRGRAGEEPQTSFSEVVLNIEAEPGLDILHLLEVRDRNREAANTYNKADGSLKEQLKALGYYDGQPHEIRVGPFVVSIVPSDGEVKHIEFDRAPTIRKIINKG